MDQLNGERLLSTLDFENSEFSSKILFENSSSPLPSSFVPLNSKLETIDSEGSIIQSGSGEESEFAKTEVESFFCLWIEIEKNPLVPESEKICGRSFKNLDDLVNHTNSAHILNPKTPHRNICRWQNCARNLKFFNSECKLIEHVRVHTGETPFVCQVSGCGMAFKQCSGLVLHTRIHTG